MKVCVIGLGKIGLPLAAHFATSDHLVTGVDIDSEVVRLVNLGTEPFPGEVGLANRLREVVSAAKLTASDDYSLAVPQSDVVLIAVPLFVDDSHQPDFRWMDSATKSIGEHLKKNTLVIYETTLPIGTTRNRWKPMLEMHSGLIEGRDFHVVFSPERVLTGRIFEDLRKYPKLIGGLSYEGAKKARVFYESVLDFDDRVDLAKPNGVWDLGSAEAAEMAKLAETTYRDVNIALANQFATHAEDIGVDVYKVIEASNSQPYSHIHQPGISVGGHCIPIYPRLYSFTDREAAIVAAARDRNLSMTTRAVDSLDSVLGGLKNENVLILGVTYRPGVKEVAFSGAFPLAEELVRRGAKVEVIDPYYSTEELRLLGLKGCTDREWPHAIILHTNHPKFRAISQEDFPNVTQIYDGRNFLNKNLWSNANFQVLGLGTVSESSVQPTTWESG